MSQGSETGLWRNELQGSWRARGDMSGPLWGQLLLLKRLRGKVLRAGAQAEALGQEAEGSQGHVVLTWMELDSACSPFLSSLLLILSSHLPSLQVFWPGQLLPCHSPPLSPPEGCIDLLRPHNIISLCFSSAPQPSAVLTPPLLQTSRSTPLGVLLPWPDQDTEGLGPPGSTLGPTGSAQVTGRV